MNYTEVSDHLLKIGTEAGDQVRVVKSDIADATALYLIPVAWFIAFAAADELFIGTYAGKELRMRGTKQVKFADLTFKSLEHEVIQARERWFIWMLGL
jgi:hypothetical protein